MYAQSHNTEKKRSFFFFEVKILSLLQLSVRRGNENKPDTEGSDSVPKGPWDLKD